LRYLKTFRAWRSVERSDTFDRDWETDTTDIVRTEEFSSTSENLKHAVYYRASPSKTVDRILAALKIRHEEFVFIDFGSGKGRTLLQASAFPFKRVIGVEFEPSLHAIAEKNVAVYRKRGKGIALVELVCEDATKYRLPVENTVFYFFDPFKLPVVRAVMGNIRESLSEHPRKVFVVYVNPSPAVMDECSFLDRIHDSRETGDAAAPENRLSIAWQIYESRGSDISIEPSSSAALTDINS